jgi:hypothetical protein
MNDAITILLAMKAEGIKCPHCGTILNRFCSRTPLDKNGDVITTNNPCEKKDGSGCKNPVRIDFIISDSDGGYKYRVVKD